MRWGEEIPLAEVLTAVNFPLTGVEVPLVLALKLVITAPESHRWIRIDWDVDGPRVFVNRVQIEFCRADACLMLAVWAAESGLPIPTATAVYRAHSALLPSLDDTHIDVLMTLAGVSVAEANRASIPSLLIVDLLSASAGMTIPSEMIDIRLNELEQLGVVASKPNGWVLRRDPARPASRGPEMYETSLGELSVTVLDGMAESRRLEAWGQHLAETTIARLRDAIPVAERATIAQQVVRGPDFDYGSSNVVFSGRTGSGPLYVAWDTNLLVHYFNYGSALWRGGSLPDELYERPGNLETVEGLEVLLALWVVRDIRMVLLPHVQDDFSEKFRNGKPELLQIRRENRIRALKRFAEALTLVEPGREGLQMISRDGLLELPQSAFRDALQNVPPGGDRRLVQQSVERGVHIFLTEDRGVLAARSRLALFGLHIVHPQVLLEQLVAAGAYNCLLVPETMYWPLPDQQRVASLIEALSSSNL